MKKVVLSVAAALAFSAAPALAADLPVKAAPPVAPAAAPSPWDVAFGAAFTTDYELRGVSQSNHKPAAQGYFEVDYTATDWLKLYAGIWGSSLWTGFADAEFDITAGARFTWGNFGLDVGYIQYEYPGGGINGVGNYGEVYVKPSYKFTDWLTVGAVGEFGFDNFNGKVAFPGLDWVGDAGHYYVSGNAVITLPWKPVPDVTISINPEVGYEHYSSGVGFNIGAVSDTYWDVGLDFNYKAITLDLRYWGINIDPGSTTGLNSSPGNQCGISGVTNFCGNRFVATLKFDTTLSALK
jgi:uncharacterized protein (TIGR02001 family)